MTNLQSKLTAALNDKQFDIALALYVEWFKQVDSISSVRKNWPRQHLLNAASLARKALFDDLVILSQVSERCEKALSHFLGLSRYNWNHCQQRPNFFFMPDLPAKPFYQEAEIKGLATLVDNIYSVLHEVASLSIASQKSYVEHIGTIPDAFEWDTLRKDWQSLHLISGGVHQTAIESASIHLKRIFDHPLLPYCPPFAPEVFISTLEACTDIPPHFGISNVKLTVHIPLKVSSSASLTAGDEIFTWRNDSRVMIFDDSFLHSAKNRASESRSVLIFDIWHPDLSENEKSFIRSFMSIHTRWQEQSGFLAALDIGLR